MVAQKIIESLTHVRTLERLSRMNSPIHAMDSRMKVIMTSVYLLMVAVMPFESLVGSILMMTYPIVIQSLSGIPVKPLVTRLLLVSPFIGCMALGTILTDFRPAISYGLPMTLGLSLAIRLVLRSFLSLYAVLQLMATTTMDDFLSALKAIGIPQLIVMQLGFVIRYLTLLMEETANIVRAHTLRSGSQVGIRMNEWVTMVGNLFLRTYDRAHRVQQAMRLRS